MARKGTAAPFRTFNLQARPVSLQHMFHDRKAKPRAAAGAAAPSVHAVESLGKSGDMLSREADAGIGYREMPTLPVTPPAHRNHAAGRRVLHGILKQIANAVTAATSLTVTASPAPSQACGCPSSSTVAPVAPAACNSTCPNGQTAGYYVIVNAQSPYTPQLPYSVLGSSLILTAQSTVRIR